jgi:NAD(P)-dependent dehydrogenase (short-subunit alcohol dehydrogenase family)
MAETRVALVSGANRGIGLETVRQLSRLGLIAVIGSRDLAKGQAAAEALKAEGFEVAVVVLDVADPTTIPAAVGEVERLFGRLDVLVNNAGIVLDGPSSGASVASVDPEVVRRTFETNVMGPIRLIQAASPLMREQGYGRIVNLSSGLGQLADMSGGYPAYRLSKAALNAVTRTAANELQAAGIKVNSACPGWVRTDMGGPDAERTVEQGADTPVWLATLPDDGPTGGFFRDRRPIPW